MSDLSSDDGRSEGEASQLLPPKPSTPLPQDPSLLPLLYAITLCLYLAENVAPAPKTEIYQNIICRNGHFDFRDGGTSASISPLYKDRCKRREVQDELALVEGMERFLGVLPTILAIPYGALADKHGRNVVLSLAILGVFLEESWTFSVSWFSAVVPLRLVWLGPMFEIVGGGMGVFSTMVHVIIADVVSAESRTSIFFRLHAAGVVAAMLAQSIASALMTRFQIPWIPWVIGLACMLIGLCLSAILPSPVTPRRPELRVVQKTTEQRDAEDAALKEPTSTIQQRLFTAITSLSKTSALLTANVQLSLSMVLVFICQLGTNAISMILLLYISKKFEWSFAKANMLWFLGEGIELSMLVIFLPFLSNILLSHAHLSTHTKDRYIAQGCTFVLMVGALCLGYAPTIAVAILGLVIMSVGTGIADILRSLITYIIAPEHISVVYSTVTMLNVLGSSLAGPVYSGAFSAGLRLGAQWTGLPFIIAGGLFGLAFVTLLFVRIRPVHAESEHASNEDCQ